MSFVVKNLFSKCEHIHTKLRIYSLLLNKSLTENFILCVVNIFGFTTESCKFFFKLNCQSLVCFTSINIWYRLVSSLLLRNQFLACSKGLEISAQELLHDNQYTFRTWNIIQTSIGWRSPKKLFRKLLTQADFSYYKKGYFIVKGGFLLVIQDMQ